MSEPTAPSAPAAPVAAPAAPKTAENAPKTADPAAPASAPYKTLKVNGKDLAVESEAKFEELARLGASSTERFEAGKRMKEEAAGAVEFQRRFAEAAKGDPEGLIELLEKKFGHGERLAKFYETRVGRMVREQIETPEEKAVRLEKEELETYRTQAQRTAAEKKQADERVAVQAQAKAWGEALTSIATEAGFDMTDEDMRAYVIPLLATDVRAIRQEARRQGVKVERAEALAIAKRLHDRMERGRQSKWLEKLRATPDDQIVETFGEDFLKRIRTADLRRAQAGGGVPTTKPESAPSATGKANGGKRRTFSNFEDLLADRASKSST